MTRGRSWGALVAVAVGCAGAQGAGGPAAQAPAPAASSAPAAASSGPPSPTGPPKPPAPRVGPLVMALPEASKQGAPWAALARATVRYGRGELRFVAAPEGPSRERLFPSCPLGGGGEPCAVFEISTAGRAPGDDRWRFGAEAGAGLKASGVKAAPEQWTDFSPGKDVVYVHTRGIGRVDRVDERGEVSPWFEDRTLGISPTTRVIELGERRVLLGAGASGVTVAELNLDGEGKVTGKKGEQTLSMEAVNDGRPNAQGVRDVVEQGKKAMIAGPEVVVWPGAKPEAWGMVWVEGIAPPFDWPEGRVFKAKNSCGGWKKRKRSRGLADRSIEKRLHLTRFSGAVQVSDVVLRSTSDLAEVVPLVARSTDKGAWINGEVYDEQGKRIEGSVKRQAAPVDVVTPLERVVSLAFDAGSKQGVLLVQVGQQKASHVDPITAEIISPPGASYFFRRFDERGAFVGEPVWLPKGSAPDAGLVRSGGKWFALSPRSGRLLSLDDGKSLALPAVKRPALDSFGRPFEVRWGALASSGGLRLFVEQEGEARRSFLLGSGGLSPAPLPLSWADAGSTPILSFAGGAARALVTRHNAAERSFAVDALREGSKPEVAWEVLGLQGESAAMFDVWGDSAVLLAQGGQTLVRWLGAKREERLPGAFASLLPDGAGRWQATGPVLLGGKGRWILLGDRASYPASEGYETIERCSHSVATGPSRAVVACGEAAAGLEPGVRVGLRLIEAAGP